jgi:hypothetical protein
VPEEVSCDDAVSPCVKTGSSAARDGALWPPRGFVTAEIAMVVILPQMPPANVIMFTVHGIKHESANVYVGSDIVTDMRSSKSSARDDRMDRTIDQTSLTLPLTLLACAATGDASSSAYQEKDGAPHGCDQSTIVARCLACSRWYSPTARVLQSLQLLLFACCFTKYPQCIARFLTLCRDTTHALTLPLPHLCSLARASGRRLPIKSGDPSWTRSSVAI